MVISSQTLNRQAARDEYHVRSAAMGAGADPRKSAAFELGCSSHKATGRKISGSFSVTVARTPR